MVGRLDGEDESTDGIESVIDDESIGGVDEMSELTTSGIVVPVAGATIPGVSAMLKVGIEKSTSTGGESSESTGSGRS